MFVATGSVAEHHFMGTLQSSKVAVPGHPRALVKERQAEAARTAGNHGSFDGSGGRLSVCAHHARTVTRYQGFCAAKQPGVVVTGTHRCRLPEKSDPRRQEGLRDGRCIRGLHIVPSEGDSLGELVHLVGVDCLLFTQVAHDAHIGLFAGNDDLKNMYEIVIGNSGNKESRIRYGFGGKDMVVERTPTRVTNQVRFRLTVLFAVSCLR